MDTTMTDQTKRLFTARHDAITKIHEQLKHLFKISNDESTPTPPEQLADLVETAFWASLLSNEDRKTVFVAVLSEPEGLPGAMRFKAGIPFTEAEIAKIAPAVPRGGCLGVSHSDNGFKIWGFGIDQPSISVRAVTVAVSEPGEVRVGLGPFQPFAVLKGRANPIVASVRKNVAFYIQEELHKKKAPPNEPDGQAEWSECLAFMHLARAVFSRGHGGTILIVPEEQDLGAAR